MDLCYNNSCELRNDREKHCCELKASYAVYQYLDIQSYDSPADVMK